MLVHMITWSEMRYSEPLHPLLAIIVIAAGTEGFASVHVLRWRRVP